MTTTKKLIEKLQDLHAPIRQPTIAEYQYAAGEAALRLGELYDHLVDANEKLRRGPSKNCKCLRCGAGAEWIEALLAVSEST